MQLKYEVEVTYLPGLITLTVNSEQLHLNYASIIQLRDLNKHEYCTLNTGIKVSYLGSNLLLLRGPACSMVLSMYMVDDLVTYAEGKLL